MKTIGQHIDPGRCPLCGEPNLCVRADGDQNSGQPCWCKSASFPQALLDKVPAAAKNQVCICRRCLESHRDKPPQP